MAADLPVPRRVFAHGWLLVGGEKMSKSKLTGIAPSQITDVFGSDAFRYYFLRAINFGQDGSFSWEDLSARYQAELANGFGNLASRVVSMVGRYCDGTLPAATERHRRRRSASHEVPGQQPSRCARERRWSRFAIHEGAQGGSWTIRRTRKAQTGLPHSCKEPWEGCQKTRKPQPTLHKILYTAVEGTARPRRAMLSHPWTRGPTQKLWRALGARKSVPSARSRDQAQSPTPEVVGAPNWPPGGGCVAPLEGLFPRIRAGGAV